LNNEETNKVRMTKLYLLPGLGFDHRIFQKLDLENFDCTFIDWIEPKKKEPIQDYAQRLAEPIKNEGTTILIGHSMGGILAQEISSFKHIDKIILISSIKSREEVPFQFRIVKPLGLQYFFTKEISTATLRFWGPQHDYVSLEEQALFKSMVGNCSNHYLQWALRQLSIWQTPDVPSHTSIFHIHGTKDKTLPFDLVKSPDAVVRMVGILWCIDVLS